VADELRADQQLQGVTVRPDASGQPRRGQDGEAAWAEFTYTRVAEGVDPVEEVVYVWCRPFSATAMIRVVHGAPATAYDGDVAKREAVVERLVVPAAKQARSPRVVG
jgi:hypothetical protein